jgi:multicomponent Na+:H+ antiporter subunit E
MYRIIPFIVLLFTYTALSGDAGIANLLLGSVVAAGVLSLLRPTRRAVNWRQLPGAFAALAVYIVILVRTVILSGIQLARVVIHPDLPINSGIIAIPPECDSEFGRAMSAHAISLAPGELLIEMGADGTMYIHSLDLPATERQTAASQQQRRRLLTRIAN